MAGRRLALIVASSEYEDGTLRQLAAPAQDARELSRVLADPTLGGFQVHESQDQPAHLVKQQVEEFFAGRNRDDLLLLYFSGHGIKDEGGRLYFATRDTRRHLLRSTAIAAPFVNDVMQDSDSRRQVLILDCCYSGAFARGMMAKSDLTVGTREAFEGQGRLVLTASDAMQYAFEGDRIDGAAIQSVFTRALVAGIESGEADQDNDGRISFEELYQYVRRHLSQTTPQQRPKKWAFDVDGDLYVSQSRRQRTKEPPPRTVRRLLAAPSEEALEAHYRTVMKLLLDGRIVWHLGDGANLVDRPAGVSWASGDSEYPPTPSELASHLVRHFNIPSDETDLARVSEHIVNVYGSADLHDALRSVLSVQGPPTSLHTFLAGLPRHLRGRVKEFPGLVIETVHYDDSLERAFRAEGEPFDLLAWQGDDLSRGLFRHTRPDGRTATIDIPNRYRDLSLDGRTIILKLSGTFDRTDPDMDRYSVSDYVNRGPDLTSLPVTLAAHFRKRHHLFLGVPVGDWSWRTYLQRFFGEGALTYRSWAIQTDATEYDGLSCSKRSIDVIALSLDRYIVELTRRLREMPEARDR